MSKNRIAKALGLVAILCAIAGIAFWYLGHRPIAYHNESLHDLIGTANQVELSLAPQYGADGQLLDSDPPLVITGRSEIDQILRCCELPWHLRASNRFHECGGHANPAKHLESALTSNKSSRTTFRLRPSSLSNRERTSIVS